MAENKTGNEIEIHRGIIMIGDPGVGKTQLTNRFMNNEFSPDYIITKRVNVQHKELDFTSYGYYVELHVYDLIGHSKKSVEIAKDKSEEFKGTQDKGIHGLLIVSDVMRESTINGMEGWINSMGKQKELQHLLGLPIGIIINKYDLLDRDNFMKWYDSQERKNFETSLMGGIEKEYEYDKKQHDKALTAYKQEVEQLWDEIYKYPGKFDDYKDNVEEAINKLLKMGIPCIQTSARAEKSFKDVEMAFIKVIKKSMENEGLIRV